MASSHKLRAKAAQKALRRQFASLAQVISPLKVAQELFSAEVIDGSTMETVRNLGVTREDKAHDVLWAVFSALETNPSAFDKLCNVLSSEAASEDIARKLKAEFDVVHKDLIAPKKPPKARAQHQHGHPQPLTADSGHDFTHPSDYIFKFILIGDTGVGKSCLLHQFIDGRFTQDCMATVGTAFGSTMVNVASKSVRLQVWDTAGQEKYRAITKSYYRGVAGILLVYDISSHKTYDALVGWLTEAREWVIPNVVIMLVGNKKDLEANREVTFEEISTFAQREELSFMETSAKTGENVEEVFLHCTRLILSKIDTGVLDPEHCSGIRYGNEHDHIPTTKNECWC